MSGIGEQDLGWRDDPIPGTASDTLQRVHVARRVAKLVAEAHSWESSLVFGLTGPWGSGKTSLIEMVCECLGEADAKWSIARFTPWATSSTDTLLTEFYAALSSSLPKSKGRQARTALATCAQVAAPALRLVPGAGDVLSDGVSLAAEALSRRPSWHVAFAKCAEELKQLNRPVLVVADDVDRLQHDELVTLLKVIRLLGRFPGVSYLLAYDEKTLFANLEGAEAGTHDGRGRLFMEKIVQYPIAVPPLLPSQMLTRLDGGLTALLTRLGRSLIPDDSRLSQLLDEFERQLTTPRAIDRYLAQVELFLSMHDPDEVDDIDLILLTLVRVQFPDLYAVLPRFRRQLTASPSVWQMARVDREEPDWNKLFAKYVRDGEDRADARAILGLVFPAVAKYSAWSQKKCRASNPDYFSRYFVHAIPEGDIADIAVTEALVEARTNGAGSELMHNLLTSTYPGRADLAISKLWSASVPERSHQRDADRVNVRLLAAVASEIEGLEGGSRSLFRRNERAIQWAAELVQRLPGETTLDELLAALAGCANRNMRLHILWSAASHAEDANARSAVDSSLITDAAQVAADDALTAVVEHLRLRDQAPTDDYALFPFMFIIRFGDVDRARRAVLAELGTSFSSEDLAARFVGLVYLVASNPIPRINSFEQETFARFAPVDDPLYEAAPADHLDEHDISWPNRRVFVRGRAKAPHAPAG